MSTPRIMFYHDGRHPLIYMYEPPMQKEEYQHAVDEIAGTPIDVLMFGVGDGRTVLYDTKVGELWGHHLNHWNHAIWRRTHQNARALIDAGHDPLQVASERAHDKGMLIYTVLLVQMPSGERGGEETLNTRGSLFRFENKQWDIGAAGDLDPEWPGYECADFKHQEIRDERFTLIDEMLSNYPVNGLELNLVHLPYYFHPNEVEEGRQIMTDWIRRVHDAVKSGGEERELVIQVPNSVDEACQSASTYRHGSNRESSTFWWQPRLRGPTCLTRWRTFVPWLKRQGVREYVFTPVSTASSTPTGSPTALSK